MNWVEARVLYETRPGTTYQDIADSMGCTQQNVGKRARKEGWEKADDSTLAVARDMSVSQPTAGSALGKRTKENVAQIINTYALTGRNNLSAGVVGISTETLKNWCIESPELLLEMDARRKQFLCERVAKIADAKDWKAHKELLARAPETKDDWGETQKEGPTIILNIQRD